jgi:polyferredoxin
LQYQTANHFSLLLHYFFTVGTMLNMWRYHIKVLIIIFNVQFVFCIVEDGFFNKEHSLMFGKATQQMVWPLKHKTPSQVGKTEQVNVMQESA